MAGDCFGLQIWSSAFTKEQATRKLVDNPVDLALICLTPLDNRKPGKHTALGE
jgi:hypothetical protein